jgi:hypothetical protein
MFFVSLVGAGEGGWARTESERAATLLLTIRTAIAAFGSVASDGNAISGWFQTTTRVDATQLSHRVPDVGER